MDWIKDNLSNVVIGLLTLLIGVASYFVVATIDDLKTRPTKAEVKVLILEQTKTRFENIEQDVASNKSLILTIQDMKKGIDNISTNQIKLGKDVAIIKDRLKIKTN